ncbi:MAG: TonB-dependent receptor plug domain-containing protein [Candidatus Eisenbacteria bacterium]
MGRSQHSFSLPRPTAWNLALAVFAVFALQAIMPTSAAALATLQGKLVATDSGEPIGFADILLIPADTTMRKVGGLSNADGTFLLKAAAGRYTLQIRALSYSRRRVENLDLPEGQLVPFSTTLEPEAIQQKEIVVEATAKQNTEASVLATRKKASTVGDAVSAEQIRRAPDKNASDVLRRVTGLSVSEGKYVFVRGMGERYNSTEVDGVRVASPEQGKRVVPMDLFPSALIDNIVVQKTWSADRSGEFSGGDVQLHLKDFPGKRAWSLSVSQSMTDGTTFKNRLSYASSHRDAFGFGASSRDLPAGAVSIPADQRYSASTFSNVWSPKTMKTLPNGSYALTYGDEIKPFGKSLGVIQAITLSRSFDQRAEVERFVNGTDPSVVTSTYSGQRSNESVQLGANTKLSMRLSPSQVVSLRGIYLNKADDEVRSYQGNDPKEPDQVAWRVHKLSYIQRTLRSVALEGKHDFQSLAHSTLDWTFSRNDARRQSPDKREMRYRANLENPDPVYVLSPGIREYGDLRENGWGTTAKLTLPYRSQRLGSGRFVAGFDRQSRRRDNRYRMFRFQPAGFVDAPGESLFHDTPANPNSVEAFLGLDNDNYFAGQLIEATFLTADLPLGKRLRGSVGLRREFGSQEILSRGLVNASRVVREGFYQSTDYLTGLNLTFAWNEKFNIRGAASRTLNRPDMDDLSPQQFQEQPNGSTTVGNPSLRRSLITNYDLRFEVFPNVGEVFAAGFFYKAFSDPIELANFPGDITKPTNSDGGHNLGVELEARANLSHLHPVLKPFALNSNLSLVRSEIDLVQTTDLGNRQHSLVGQAPYMLNVGVTWASPSGRSEITLLTSSVGRRLKELKVTDGVGFEQKRSNREFDALTTLDIAASLTPFKGVRLKLAAGNLLDSVVRELEGPVESRSYRTGHSYSVSLSLGQ